MLNKKGLCQFLHETKDFVVSLTLLYENCELIKITILLNKPSRLTLYKEEIEEELANTIKKDIRLELIYTNKLFGLDYYSVT